MSQSQEKPSTETKKSNPKSPGRPTKKSDERMAIILDGLENYLPFDIACDYAKVHERTAARWMAEDEDFALAVSYAKSKAQRGVVSDLVKKDPKYWLQKRDAKNWADTDQPKEFKVIVNMPNGTKREV